jgi:L-lactate dehydrogenase complex protein LldG
MDFITQFCSAAEAVGTQVISCKSLQQAVDYIVEQVDGTLLCPSSSSGERIGLIDKLTKAGAELVTDSFRERAPTAKAGVTGANFGIADTGTIVLESTDEPTRLASTLPEQHFVLLDPEKIVADGIEAVAPLRDLHQLGARNFIAYITGPSRTADIERVLTIGVHGPKKLHILLVPGLSSDPMEN